VAIRQFAKFSSSPIFVHIQYIELDHLHDRAGTLVSLLYKDEKLSVCLSAFFGVTLLAQSSRNVSTQDLVCVIAMVSGMSKFVFINF